MIPDALQEKQLAEFENCRVLVADQKVETIKDIIPVLEQMMRANQPLLIITEDVTGATVCFLSAAIKPCSCIELAHHAQQARLWQRWW